MTRSLSACALALGLSLACSAQETTIHFGPLWDSIALSSGLGAALASELFLDSAGSSGAKPDASSLSGLDALACLPYDEGMSKASMAAEGVALLWPALFALSGSSGELLPAAASYAEGPRLDLRREELPQIRLPQGSALRLPLGESLGGAPGRGQRILPFGACGLGLLRGDFLRGPRLRALAEQPCDSLARRGRVCCRDHRSHAQSGCRGALRRRCRRGRPAGVGDRLYRDIPPYKIR